MIQEQAHQPDAKRYTGRRAIPNGRGSTSHGSLQPPTDTMDTLTPEPAQPPEVKAESAGPQAIAQEPKGTDQALQSALARTQELYEISRHIGLVRSPDEVLYALLSSSYLEQTSRAFIAVFARPWDSAEPRPSDYSILAAWSDHPDPPGSEDPGNLLQDHLLTDLCTRDHPVLIEDIRADARLAERVRDRLEALQTRSLLLFPLLASGQWYGMLSLHWGSPQKMSQGDVRHIQGLVDQAAVAIYNMRLLEAEARARREAEKANELKLRFLAMVSHELRTPLTSIKGFATTLLADDVTWPASAQKSFIETIDKEADKLTDLIEQLLDFSRLDAGTLRISPEKQCLGVILSLVMPALQASTAAHRLVINVPENLPAVMADPQRIAQVLSNLVSNAAKYSPSDTTIQVSARADGSFVQLDVADQGPGIPPEERSRVFEAFHRVDGAGTRRVKGAGLGLAICKGLVEAHGGRIWIADRPGPGTTVSFVLPRAV